MKTHVSLGQPSSSFQSRIKAGMMSPKLLRKDDIFRHIFAILLDLFVSGFKCLEITIVGDYTVVF